MRLSARLRPGPPRRLPAPELSPEWRARVPEGRPVRPAPRLPSRCLPPRDGTCPSHPGPCFCELTAARRPEDGTGASGGEEERRFVVVLRGDSRSVLTDSDLRTRAEAEAEAAAWNRRDAWRGRAGVCEVRAAGDGG